MPHKPTTASGCGREKCGSAVTRRRFLATTGAAATLPIVAGPFTRSAQAAEGDVRHFVPADKQLSPEWIASLTARGEEKVWSGDELNTLALPIGGIGAGQMYLLGDGSLACWHIYNHTFFTGYGATNYQAKEIPGIRLEQGFQLVVKSVGGKVLAARRLNRDGFPKVGFIGRYPIGRVLYRDETLPVKVELEAFSPFIPLNTLDSTLPATILEFSLKNTSSEPVVVELAGRLENPVGVHSAQAGIPGRRRQKVGRSEKAAWIDYAGLPADAAAPKQPAAKGGPFEQQTDFGTVRFALLGETDWATADANAQADEAATVAVFANRPGEVTYDLGETRLGALGRKLSLAPGQTAAVPFVLAWHFPIRRWGYPEFGDVGNYYATRFSDAGAVLDYVKKNYDRLCAETRLYCKTFYDQSTLPAWFLERIGSTPSILATGTVHWRRNGRFWGWEGVGCCSGTCTHVWNYEHALARLFPELERSMRELQDFGAGFSGSGLVSFRGDSYETPAYAADGQCGTVLKAYREHLVSRDEAFLRRNYDKIKRALHF